MKNGIIPILLLTIFFCLPLGAQTFKHNHGKGKGQFDIEAYQKKKEAFLIKEMNLTKAEAEAFIPLVHEYSQKKFEINFGFRSKMRELSKKKDKTEDDYKVLINTKVEAMLKESELRKEYYDKFMKVLLPSKLAKYSKADKKFMKEELNSRRKGWGAMESDE